MTGGQGTEIVEWGGCRAHGMFLLMHEHYPALLGWDRAARGVTHRRSCNLPQLQERHAHPRQFWDLIGQSTGFFVIVHQHVDTTP